MKLELALTRTRFWNHSSRSWRVVSGIALVALLASVPCRSNDEDSEPDLPVVASAGIPFYPSSARMMGAEGIVRLKVSTNLEDVSSVQVLEGGGGILADAALKNVKTWHFQPHIRTSFETVFRYKLLPKPTCLADNGTVLLRLPTEVEVTASRLQTCDGATTIR